MAIRLTKRQVINAMLEDENIKNNATYVDYLTHELELLDNKKANKKETSKKARNEAYKDLIVAYLTKNGKSTISDMIHNIAEFDDFTPQKVSALLIQLSDAQIIVRVEEKRKPYYKIAVVGE